MKLPMKLYLGIKMSLNISSIYLNARGVAIYYRHSFASTWLSTFWTKFLIRKFHASLKQQFKTKLFVWINIKDREFRTQDFQRVRKKWTVINLDNIFPCKCRRRHKRNDQLARSICSLVTAIMQRMSTMRSYASRQN